MAFRRQSSSQKPLSEINMIPFIDVMLVLLIVFIISAPLLTHAVKIDLPKVSSAVNEVKPETIDLGIKEDGTLYWNESQVDEAEIADRMQIASGETPKPELHILADGKTPYETVSRIMALAAKAGLNRIGFVSDPRNADIRSAGEAQ